MPCLVILRYSDVAVVMASPPPMVENILAAFLRSLQLCICRRFLRVCLPRREWLDKTATTVVFLIIIFFHQQCIA